METIKKMLKSWKNVFKKFVQVPTVQCILQCNLQVWGLSLILGDILQYCVHTCLWQIKADYPTAAEFTCTYRYGKVFKSACSDIKGVTCCMVFNENPEFYKDLIFLSEERRISFSTFSWNNHLFWWPHIHFVGQAGLLKTPANLNPLLSQIQTCFSQMKLLSCNVVYYWLSWTIFHFFTWESSVVSCLNKNFFSFL